MNRTALVLALVLADFVGLTAWALYHHGYVGLFEAALATPAGIQVGVDLVLAMTAGYELVDRLALHREAFHRENWPDGRTGSARAAG